MRMPRQPRATRTPAPHDAYAGQQIRAGRNWQDPAPVRQRQPVARDARLQVGMRGYVLVSLACVAAVFVVL